MGRPKLPDIDPVTGQKRVIKQRRYEQRQRALGNCIICGRPKGDSPYVLWCRRHGAMHRLTGKKRHGRLATGKGRGSSRLLDIPVQNREELDRVFPAPPPRARKKKDAPIQ